MAELRDRIDITVEELEESLGAANLPRFISESEKSFLSRIDAICTEICVDRSKKAIFVSGPTSSGKTTFTLRLTKTINEAGRKACHLSLDDYYNLKEIICDREGRPDFETIDALDVDRIQNDVEQRDAYEVFQKAREDAKKELDEGKITQKEYEEIRGKGFNFEDLGRFRRQMFKGFHHAVRKCLL